MTQPTSPRVCFYGRAGTGSFEIRARQLASTHTTWQATSRLEPEHYLASDVVCFVKQVEPRKMRLLRQLGKRVVFDLVDCWRQPEDDRRVADREGARALFRRRLDLLEADAVIYPTRAMQQDLGDLLPPGEVIHHHARPGLEPVPLREQVRRVGYEGDPRFLGSWEAVLAAACRRRGLSWVGSASDLRELDVVVAARGGVYAGYLALRYKSNVKLANAYGAGLPALLQAESEAYRETACPGVRWFSTPEELGAGLDELLPLDARQRVREAFLVERERHSLARAGERYARLFTRLCAPAEAS